MDYTANMADATTSILMIFLSLVFIIGVPGNLLIIIVYWKKAHKTSVHILITGLAFADFFACLLRPVSMVYWMMEGSSGGGIDIGQSMYILSNFQTVSSSLFLTAAIAFDRHDAICRPHNRLVTAHRAKIVVRVCILLSFILSIPVCILIFFWRKNQNVWVTIFATLIPCLIYGTVLIISIVLYSKLFCTIRARAKVRACAEAISIPCSSTESSGDPYRSMTPRPSVPGDETGKASIHQVTECERGNFESTSSKRDTTQAAKSQMLELFLASEFTISNANVAGSNLRNDIPSASMHEPSTVGSTPSSFTQPGGQWSPKVCCRRQPSSGGSITRRHQQNRADIHGKTTRMLLITTMVFFVTWCPALFVNLLPLYTIITSDAGIAAVVFMKNIIYINNALNPFIYSVGNKHFREDCLKILRNLGCSSLRRRLERTPR